jgi:TolA-binding protein
MFRRVCLFLLIVSPALWSADKTTETMLEVLRDIGGLQEQIKAFEQSVEAKLAAVNQTGAQQAQAAAEQAGKSIAALGDDLRKSLQSQQDQQTRTHDAVAGVGSQIQAVFDQLSTMRQAVNDLTATMSRLSTEVSDLSTAVKSVQTAKPDVSGATPTPQISATDLFANADADRLGGKLDLALQEYSDYAAKFGNTPQAADAQYYVGSIHYSKQQWDDAVKSFDALLQTYPDSKRAPESLYYKADSLARLGRWSDADDTLRELRRRFPDNRLAQQGLTVKPPGQ